jgi:hypothetical protein
VGVKRVAVLVAFVATAAAVGSAAGADATKLTLSLSESSPSSFVSGSTLYYAPTGTNGGSFTVTATASGTLAKVEFPEVFGSDDATVTSKPYSQTYTWGASATASGAKAVKATDSTAATPKTTQASFTVTPDKAPPTGQAVTLGGGPGFSTLSVPLTLAGGTDDGAGVDGSSGVVERASATLTHGTCGTFGSLAAVTLSGGADTSVSTGSCYRYQYKLADNVGNLSAASSQSADALVDVTPPSAPGLVFSGLSEAAAAGSVVYYRPGAGATFTVSASSGDPESAVASYAFPAPPGFSVLGAGPSRTFSVPSGQAGPVGPLTVTATNGTGVASEAASFSLAADPVAPTVTLSCNGKPCRTTAYPQAVTVALNAADSGGSGIGTIRYTFDGTTPARDRGAEYEGPFVVRTTTTLLIRAFDRVGNAGSLVRATVRSLADRFIFAAPAHLSAKADAQVLSARLTSSHRAIASATMLGPGLTKPHRWRFLLDPGTSLVQLHLPALHAGRYTITWSARSRAQTTRKTTRVVLR